MWLEIRPKEPLLLGEARAGSQFLVGQTYIPGRALRGAWAEWLARQDLNNEQILEAVNRVRFGNFFPAAEWYRLCYALPLPMSAFSCKLNGGFVREPYPEHRGHGVVDVLLPRLAYLLLEEKGARFPVPFLFLCQQCQGRMEALGGFYAVYKDGSGEHYVLFRPKFHAQTRVALSRYRRASAEGMLYTASALSPKVSAPDGSGRETNLVFVGRVHPADGNALASLQGALKKVALGALHTRGYGRVEVQETEMNLPPLEERVRVFNETLKTLWKDVQRLAVNAGDLPQEPESLYFSVDLLAPGVFREEGVPSLVPVLGVGGQTLKPIFWMTRPDMASGWSTAWGLPKPTNLAARMGSVYVFRWDGSPEELLPALQTLETQGVGERRDEGFGECLICHPFHLEVEER